MSQINLLATWTLAERELVRFIRQRNRVFGALAQPVLFWALFGAGFGASFQPGGETGPGYSEYFFPGTVVLILLFTAIFATISIIEDRNEGFLQGVMVSPVSTATIVAGKILGTVILATGQASLVFLLAPLAGVPLTLSGVLLGIPLLAFIAVALAGLGFSIAWRLDSTQGFHAVMTAFLMPMWLLSGAFFPADGVPSWLGWIIAINPLTYGVAAFRHVLYLDGGAAVVGIPGLAFSLVAVLFFAVGTFALALAVASRRTIETRS
ncbi:MAG: ABC-2 type transport system permease protein [Hyphomicrobiaceae bacterium]|jgi:ABC-2 type transport system permease protein